MSFLNPVNEPVLRFKSTDTGAPQINYNARTVGDVKAVLKACLVTGYGAVPSAGWSAVNEVSNIIEFVSPSAAMSGYRLGIDDSTTTKTDWYYQYQDVRVNPTNNAPPKALSFIDKVNAQNGWQLLVTERGLYFIEIVMQSVVSQLVARVTFWGQTKSNLISSTQNIGYMSVGYGSQTSYPSSVFKPSDITTSYKYYRIGDYSALSYVSSNMAILAVDNPEYSVTGADMVSEVYIHSAGLFVAQQAGLYLKTVSDKSKLYGVSDSNVDAIPVLSVCVALQQNSIAFIERSARTLLLRLDYWEY